MENNNLTLWNEQGQRTRTKQCRAIEMRPPAPYTGSKHYDLRYLIPLVPSFAEYREPLVGMGAVFLYLRRVLPERRYWINDLNPDVFAFWVSLRDQPEQLLDIVSEWLGQYRVVRDLVCAVKDWHVRTTLQRAARFFLLQRTSFRGMPDKHVKRNANVPVFTMFSVGVIDRLRYLARCLPGVRITNMDYESVCLSVSSKKTFCFLDPPYYGDESLYGESETVWGAFDHDRLVRVCDQMEYPWLVTYNDTPEVRDRFAKHRIIAWVRTRRMGYTAGSRKSVLRQIAILNYELPLRQLPLDGGT